MVLEFKLLPVCMAGKRINGPRIGHGQCKSSKTRACLEYLRNTWWCSWSGGSWRLKGTEVRKGLVKALALPWWEMGSHGSVLSSGGIQPELTF